MIQTYDIHKTYLENYRQGPQFAGPPPAIPATPAKEFLGFKVRSRIGIAAGLLLNGKWVTGYAQHGFDLLTYKTVRSAHRPCYDPPNWVFVEENDQAEGPVHATDIVPADPTRISSAVCFGMPSMDPAEWRKDINDTKDALGEGQILIVSVVATPEPGATRESVAADFAQCARWASAAGADIVEANFSCPNVCTPEGTIYQDPELSRFIASEIRASIPATPLLLKIGHFNQPESQRVFLSELNAFVDGITLVNGVSRPVLNRDGSPVFGKDYVNAGVLGRAIHEPCVANVETAAEHIRARSLDLALLAVGGISQTRDMADFFAAGADAVMLGSSPMYLPNLAIEAKSAHPEW